MTDDKKPAVVKEEKPAVVKQEKSKIDIAMEKKSALEQKINEISTLIAQKQSEMHDLQQEVGMLTTAIERLRPADENQQAIRAYLESQAKLRESGMAPIDASMMRVKRRGTKRPTRSIM